MTMTVIVPTYKRSRYLMGCLESIYGQTRLPERVLVIVRDGDDESLFAVKDFIEAHASSIQMDVVMVHEAGFLPPVQAGIEAVRSDIAAFIDDDAQAFPDWLERLERGYRDPLVGAVGGRVVQIFGGIEKKYKPAKVFGKVFWCGRCDGNLYRDGLIGDTFAVIRLNTLP